ncbi:MAG: ThiF family adenylyltransferase [Anaerolineae bacterium]|nr:ThiF family adenylyltransferase [Anaerolineae bacterium]
MHSDQWTVSYSSSISNLYLYLLPPMNLTDIATPYRVITRQEKRIAVFLIGCGGTGSQLAPHLARTLLAARERDIEAHAVFVDSDSVEEKNVLARQNFCAAEIGRNKAVALAWRYNAAYGLNIAAIPEALTVTRARSWLRQVASGMPVLFIGCVDNTAARAAMATIIEGLDGRGWWLDSGNAYGNGHILLGNSARPRKPKLDMGLLSALPAPHIQDPAIIAAESQSKAMSCAELTLAAAQGPVVNTIAAALAAQYVHNSIVTGSVTAFATRFNSDPPVVRSRLTTATELAPYWDCVV